MMIDINDKKKLIEKINLLGPWTHGYFELGNGIVIEDNDDIQKPRLLKFKKYFKEIIRSHYQKETLEDKTLCEIGCYTGYFVFEMLKCFNFMKVTGLEPRERNLAKARFIKQLFELSDQKFELREYDILNSGPTTEKYDVVLMPGVLHHLDNHLNALQNLYSMTRELCIIETLVLPGELNNDQSRKYLELKDSFYKDNHDYFGLVGYKYESGDLDGSAVRGGIVAVPTVKALMMMLKHVGFDDIEIYKSEEDLKKEIYHPNLYRNTTGVIISCTKRKTKNEKNLITANKLNIEKNEIYTSLPYSIIAEVYAYTVGKKQINELADISRWVVVSQEQYSTPEGDVAWKQLGGETDLSIDELCIIATLKHAFEQKVAFEYAKALYQKECIEDCLSILKKLITVCNLDWRTVYRTYFLLSLIYYDRQEYNNSSDYLEKSLRAYPNFLLAKNFSEKLSDKIRCT
ncbi:MAG: DUF1698 domain-containing protein [Proteobacteria bacterium]|nr:DUF1698 domain-containing protein [Pseudomonadota bacterium]MBU1389471.1 DUF1698 domain-containing protein [Pseudomonadota bacterium]MBU1541291.1 DUF1698 domain-containing protein [Pseudomonadota bacterium]